MDASNNISVPMVTESNGRTFGRGRMTLSVGSNGLAFTPTEITQCAGPITIGFGVGVGLGGAGGIGGSISLQANGNLQ